MYIKEIIEIEKQAKRLITRAIELDKRLVSSLLEKNNSLHEITLKELIMVFGELNAVANFTGKGRSDFTITTLEAASNAITEKTSKAVKALAYQIKDSFDNLRSLMQVYGKCVEDVDPQLRENQDLVEALMSFEKAWERGLHFLVNDKLSTVFKLFSVTIEQMVEQNMDMQEKVRAMDVEVFLMIPCIAVLWSLEENDSRIYSLCENENRLWKEDEFLRLKQLYEAEKNCDVHAALEKAILRGEATDKIAKLFNEIKQMAVILQRSNPNDWNNFIELIINNQ